MESARQLGVLSCELAFGGVITVPFGKDTGFPAHTDTTEPDPPVYGARVATIGMSVCSLSLPG